MKQRSVIMSVSMHRKKEHVTEMNYKKRILFQDKQQHNCFNKNEIRVILELFLALSARKNFAFAPRFRKQKLSLVS